MLNVGMAAFGVLLWCRTNLWCLGVGLKWQGCFDARHTRGVQNFVRIFLKCFGSISVSRDSSACNENAWGVILRYVFIADDSGRQLICSHCARWQDAQRRCVLFGSETCGVLVDRE